MCIFSINPENTLSATDTIQPDCPSSVTMPEQQGAVLQVYMKYIYLLTPLLFFHADYALMV